MKSRAIALMLLGLGLLAFSAAPALAWWQFAAWNPNGERKVYRYPSEKACEAALKQLDTELAKKYPKLYPRVGSCEEYK